MKCVRGVIRLPRTGVAPPGPAEEIIANLNGTVGEKASELAGCRPATGEAAYLPNRGAIDGVGGNAWGFIPMGAETVLVQPMGADGHLVILSDQPRAFSGKERAWIAALANKLNEML